MSKLFYIEGSVADGLYESEATSKTFSECELAYIKFYDGEGLIAPVSAGTITVQYSPEGTVWRDVEGGVLDAATVHESATIMPYAQGLVNRARVQMDSIVGPVTFRACFWRHV